MAKIDVLCMDGTPLGVTPADIWGRGKRGIGIGGSELALLTMCEAWQKIGHAVTLYNNPNFVSGCEKIFSQKRVDEFIPLHSRDILINFRSPNPMSLHANGKKVWWSCDQFSIGDYQGYSKLVDNIVCISPRHEEYFLGTYHMDSSKITVIDIPVRIPDFDIDEEKLPYSLIYNSVPDRGVLGLLAAYPRIKKEIPEASLTITSDYRLWGNANSGNQQYRLPFANMDGVHFIGALPRGEYLRELLSADVQVYPCIYDELFCISCAEAQVAGAFPITSSVGALKTTNMGLQIDGNPNDMVFVKKLSEEVIQFMRNPNKEEIRLANQVKALERFSISTILPQWEKVFNE